MNTSADRPALAVKTEQVDDSMVAVVRVPFETTAPCHGAADGSLLRPGPVETREIQPGVYPITYERCACGELEAKVTFRARLVSRTTGPLWRRRTSSTAAHGPIETTDELTGPANDIHEGRVIDVDAAGRPAAYFAHVTENGPTPYSELF